MRWRLKFLASVLWEEEADRPDKAKPDECGNDRGRDSPAAFEYLELRTCTERSLFFATRHPASPTLHLDNEFGCTLPKICPIDGPVR